MPIFPIEIYTEWKIKWKCALYLHLCEIEFMLNQWKSIKGQRDGKDLSSELVTLSMMYSSLKQKVIGLLGHLCDPVLQWISFLYT